MEWNIEENNLVLYLEYQNGDREFHYINEHIKKGLEVYSNGHKRSHWMKIGKYRINMDLVRKWHIGERNNR